MTDRTDIVFINNQGVLVVRAGGLGINRDFRTAGIPEWSWHVSELQGFVEVCGDCALTTPWDLESLDWKGAFSGLALTGAFAGLRFDRELGPSPVWLFAQPEGSLIRFQWSTPTNRVFSLEQSESIGTTNWVPVAGGPWPTSTNKWVLQPPTNQDLFYRIRATAITP